MDIGSTTRNYYAKIYDYSRPSKFDWEKACEKWRKESSAQDFIKMARDIRNLGMKSVEIWEPSLSYASRPLKEAELVKAALKKMGFEKTVYHLGDLNSGNASGLAQALTFSSALGVDAVVGSIDDPAAILPVIEEEVLRHGLKFAVENGMPPSMQSPIEVMDAIEGHEAVGASLDVGACVANGLDIVEAYGILKDKLLHVRIKDTLSGYDGCLPLGEGDAPIPQLAEALKQGGYAKMLAICYEYPRNPNPGIKTSLRNLSKLFQKGARLPSDCGMHAGALGNV
jgi:sugar phosphate isomerase/epimerase